MTLEYKNAQIHFTSKGIGNPIVFLHGFLECSKIWIPFIPELSEKRQVVCIDLPGHGKSGVIEEIHSMELMAETVHHVLQHLKIESATIVGHSMGGYVALALCESFPNFVKCLILMNSTPTEDTEERKINRERAISVVRKNKTVFISIAISNLLTPENSEKFNKEISQLISEAQKFPTSGIIAAIKGMKIRTNRIGVLKSFNREKIMILGKNDPVMNYESTKNVGYYCDCEVIENRNGHLSYLENFSQINKIVHFIE